MSNTKLRNLDKYGLLRQGLDKSRFLGQEVWTNVDNVRIMSKLRSLKVSSNLPDNFYVNPKIVPSLKKISLNGCILKNIDKFQTLEILNIRDTDIDELKLNNLNILELSLTGIGHCVQDLNIYSLRKLVLKEVITNVDMLNNLNIVELELLNINWSDDVIMHDQYYSPKLNINSLRSLTLEGIYLDLYPPNNMNIIELILRHLHLDVSLRCSTLESLVLDQVDMIHANELQNIERLTMTNSRITLRNPKMVKLSNITIIQTINILRRDIPSSSAMVYSALWRSTS